MLQRLRRSIGQSGAPLRKASKLLLLLLRTSDEMCKKAARKTTLENGMQYMYEAADELAVVTMYGFPSSSNWCTTHSFAHIRTTIHGLPRYSYGDTTAFVPLASTNPCHSVALKSRTSPLLAVNSVAYSLQRILSHPSFQPSHQLLVL